ncbi:hypothetical protein BDZ89DRAFT_1055951 [Hymenopellis radicata]|nr:hypothetical protein BDZ89DRAFT_1055951 [Hymenopellis radicata]
MTTAENLKASGALQYKARNFKAAISLFKKASELEPTVAVYLSNLSAAQYEDGQYRAASETCVRVLDMLSTDDALRPRLYSRLAKAQSFLSHDTDEEVDPISIEFCDAPRVEALKRQALAKENMKNNVVNQRLMSLPRYRHAPSSALEYFSIGHDKTRSLLRTQVIDDDDSSLHMKLPHSGAFEFSVFFCGIGDARHLYGTFLDVDHTYQSPISKKCKLHFTTVDINATVLARNLIVQLALNELSLLENPNAPRARHLLVMLHYVYLATVMPPLAVRILAELTERVDKLLSLAVKRGIPLNLGWLHVAADSCVGILNTVKWWLTTGKTVVTYADMLTRRDESSQRQSDTVPILAQREYVAYEYLRVLVPPSDSDEPDFLEGLVYEPIRNGKEDEILSSQQMLEFIHGEHIAGRWSINYTKLSPDWYQERRGEELSPFTTTSILFRDELDRITSTCPVGTLYQITSDCFWRIGQGFKKLRDRFTLEVILGDGFAVMDGIRLKTFSRSAKFPLLYDRIHASNVPDYAGGFLASFTSAMPIVKCHPQAYFTTADLVHANSWEGDYKKEHLQPLGLSSRIYTYTSSPSFAICSTPEPWTEEMAGAFTRQTSYHMFRHLEHVPQLLSKSQLETIVTGCFLRTVLPARYARYLSSGEDSARQIREVLNLHAFFRSLEIWKGLGYPTTFLADSVEQILEDRLASSVVPHDKTYVPIPRGERKVVPIRTQPFLADFEVATALWEPTVPSTSHIRRYSIKIPRQELEMYALGHVSFTQMVLLLVFGLPDDMDAVSMDSPQQWKSSLQFVSTFDYDCESSTCTLLLSQKRLGTFLENGYEAGLVNTMQWKLQSSKIPCSALQDVGDVDEWDKSIVVDDVMGRSMSRAQVGSWERVYAQAVNDYHRSRIV